MPPKWRHLVNDNVQSSDDATFRHELPNIGQLHTLLVKCSVTNGATSGRGVTILDAIDDIQVIGDGTEVLFSLIPEEIEKWNEVWFGDGLQMVQDEQAGAVQEGVFPVWFGKNVYDPNFFLPLDRFKDTNLEVTFSPAIAADGGFATGTVTIDIVALITDQIEPLSYQGTLVTRRINQFTSGASGEERVELFMESLYRAVGVYAYESGVAEGTDITAVELEDTAQGISLYEVDWDDFLHLTRQMAGTNVRKRWTLFAQDGDTVALRTSEVLGYSLQPQAAISIAANTHVLAEAVTLVGDLLTLDVALADLTAGAEDLTAHATDEVIILEVEGKEPSGFGVIPFTYLDEPIGWLNANEWGKLEVILDQGAAGADVRVSIQEMRTY